MADITQWEYRVESFGTFWSYPNDAAMTDQLNEWGLDGWEVISVTPEPNTNKIHLIARRLLTPSARRRRSYPGTEP